MNDLEPEQARQSRPSPVRTIAAFPNREEALELGSILNHWRLSQGWQPYGDDDQKLYVTAWFEPLHGAGVPSDAYGECYLAAMRRRAELKAQGKELSNLSADDLVSGWYSIRDRFMAELKSRAAGGPKLLAENNLASCQRCFGTGREEMPDGTVRDTCDHEPLSKAEIAERAAAKARSIQFVRDAARRMAPKPVPVLVQPERKLLVRLKCTECGLKADTRGGWQEGQICRAAGECPGTLEIFTPEEAREEVESEIRTAVYRATETLQQLEFDGRLTSDALDMRRRIGDFAVGLLQESWRNN